MVDMFKQGSDWLESQRTKYLTRMVTYRRGTDAIEVPATMGRTFFQIDEGGSGGGGVRFESRDFLVLAVDLVVGGMSSLPQAGDQVLETDPQNPARTVFVYEVMGADSSGVPAWRWSDPYRTTLRIHTKQVDQENNP